MAPEQADLDAVPDARWDVYALGALLYCMLTGGPPHRTGKTVDDFERTPGLSERLAHYRRTIEQSPPVAEHRRRRGVDKMLAAIVDRCLAADPEKRYPNVQAVLDALDDRARRLARRPMMVLGAIGPALLLAVAAAFALRGAIVAVGESNSALTARALESNRFAAQFAARTASNELERRYRIVEQLADSKEFRRRVAEAMANPELHKLLVRLADPKIDRAEQDKLRKQFLDNPARQALQREFEAMLPSSAEPSEKDRVASWFFCDAGGVSTLRVPVGRTIGRDFAWRSFFHGGTGDLPDTWRPGPEGHIRQTTLSDVFRSRATYCWIVAISAPVYDIAGQPPSAVPDDSTHSGSAVPHSESKPKFLGVVAMTAEVGRFVDFPGGDNQFAVLVDNREGTHKGVVLQHPLFDKLLEKDAKLPDRFKNYRVSADDLPNTPAREEHYADPLAVDAAGGEFNRHWLARMEPVRVRGANTGWIVIVQEDYETAINATLGKLKSELLLTGMIALGLIALVVAGMWGMAKRMGGSQ